jgi:hypothetical protein
MSFPNSPANNQEVQVNGIIYVWSSAKGAWRRKPGVALGNADNGDQIFNGNIIANSGARSTSVNTGAIQVTRGGGVGVTGNVWAGAFYSDTYRYANGAPLIVSTSSTSNIANIANVALIANFANTAGNIAGGEAGQLVYQSAASVTSFVTNGDIGKILASNGPGNMPIWVSLDELATLTGSPYITQLIYPNGNVGASDAGGQTIYALGTGFKPGFTMSVNNAPVVSASYITSSNVSFVTNPTAVGNYTLTVTNPNRKYYDYNYIEFIGAGKPYFLNPPGYLNFVAQNLFFNQYILVAGGYKPYNFQITAGALPGAMTIDAGSGLIQGYAPSVTDPTTFNFTVRVTDAQSQVISRNFYILVTVPVLLSNQMSLSSRGSDYIRAADADANVSIAHTMSLSSQGSDYIRAADADSNVSIAHTMSLSSQGSDFIRTADADVNLAIAHTMTISSQGSDFIRTADADVNLAIAHTMTLSSTKYNVKQAEFVGNTTAGNVVFGIDSITLPLPTGTQEGDLLVAVTANGENPAPAGWARAAVQPATDWLTVLYKLAGPSEANLTITPTQPPNVYGTYSLLAYRGVGNVVSASNFISDVTNSTAPRATNLSVDGNVSINIVTITSNVASLAVPAGTTIRAFSNRNTVPGSEVIAARNLVIYEAQRPVASTTLTVSNPTSRSWSGVSIRFPIL